jgi:quercetin dioxygenase-like cupin family protein
MKIIHGRVAGGESERRSATFTGEVWADPILASTDGVTINNVFFAPLARTHWHTHEGGQILMVTYGQGKIHAADGDEHRIRPGDTVWISPGERHWHGAGEATCMAHVAISLGAPEWLEPVTDEEYSGTATGAIEPAPPPRRDTRGGGLG